VPAQGDVFVSVPVTVLHDIWRCTRYSITMMTNLWSFPCFFGCFL
jgi:hypothetical protein